MKFRFHDLIFLDDLVRTHITRFPFPVNCPANIIYRLVKEYFSKASPHFHIQFHRLLMESRVGFIFLRNDRVYSHAVIGGYQNREHLIANDLHIL